MKILVLLVLGILMSLGAAAICGIVFFQNIWAASRSSQSPEWRDIYIHNANVSAAMSVGSLTAATLLALRLCRSRKSKG